MSTYNLNKNSSTSPSKIDTNLSIEKLLELGGTNPEYRSAFYQRLLNDDLYVLVEKSVAQDVLNNGIPEDMPVIAFGNNTIPVFSDPQRIYDGGAVQQEMDYIKVKGRTFFELVVGNPIIFNPFSKLYKELIAQEVVEMLNGQIFKPNHSPVIHARMNALVGAPKVTPKGLIQDLIEEFSKDDLVTQAHLGWSMTDKIDTRPHYLVAIELDPKVSDFASIAKRASEVCQQHLIAKQVIDIVKLVKGGDFSDYFYTQSTAFYVRNKQ